jgi:hypothetical protein
MTDRILDSIAVAGAGGLIERRQAERMIFALIGAEAIHGA